MSETDQNETYLLLEEFEDCKFPPFPLEGDLCDHIRKVRNLPVPEVEDIQYANVFVIGFPKSGSSCLWPLLKSLLKHEMGYQDHVHVFHSLDCGSPDKFQCMVSPRVLHTSYPLRYLPSQILTHRPRVIYLLRNPKDVCVSQYQQLKGTWSCMGYKGSFENFVNVFLSNTGEYWGWFRYVLQYLKDFQEHPDLPVHVIYFEDMIQNPYKVARSLCKFLNIDIEESTLQEMVESSQESVLHPAKRLRGNLDNRKQLTPDTYYCKGDVGEWRNWLTVAQDEEFDQVIDQYLTGTGLNFKYSL